MNRKAKIIIWTLSIIYLLQLCFSAMWFDDEISRWYNRSIVSYFETSTRSQNVTVYRDMVTIPKLNRKKSLHIYTPPDYENSDKSYPVIYMFDAGRLFDKKTSSREEEGIDEFLDTAIPNGGKEVIVVAIESGQFRNKELNPYDGQSEEQNEADIFMDYIVHDLKPMIDSTFRTLSNRENTAIMGASLGGLMSFYIIMNHSEVFSKAGVLSPSLLYSDKVFDLPKTIANKDIQIYMNVGEREFVAMITLVKLMEDQLFEDGFTEENLRTKIVAGGGHEPKVWRDGFEEAYPWFFGEQI